MTNLNSVFAASVSMLNADLSLDIEGTIEHAFKVEKQGVSPAFLGSTSMSQFLSISEKKKLNHLPKFIGITMILKELKNIMTLKVMLKILFAEFLLQVRQNDGM